MNKEKEIKKEVIVNPTSTEMFQMIKDSQIRQLQNIDLMLARIQTEAGKVRESVKKMYEQL